MCTTVQQVAAPLVGKCAGCAHREKHGHEDGRAVDHGRVDDLPLAGVARLQQGAHHAEGQQHAAAAEVANQVQRRNRFAAPRTDRMKRARK